MNEIHLALGKEYYKNLKTNGYTRSKATLTNKQILEYLNQTRGLKGEIVSFTVEDSTIQYGLKA